jgi:hypothetical protein
MHLDLGVQQPHRVSDFENRIVALTAEVLVPKPPKPRAKLSGDSKGDGDQTIGDVDSGIDDIKPLKHEELKEPCYVSYVSMKT